MSPLDNVRILEFPGVADPTRGVLTVIERLSLDRTSPGGKLETMPFPIKRVFYIYDVPESSRRGGHAHRSNCQILICVHGEFDLTLSDGFTSMTYHLDNPAQGIVAPPHVWTRMENFHPGTVLLVICSQEYDKSGYINDFEEFRKFNAELYSL